MQSAERTYAALGKEEQTIARKLLLRMVTLSEDGEPMRGRIDIASVVEADARGQSQRRVLDQLADARLIVLNTETAEIAHELLMWSWPRFHDWINAQRAWLQTYQEIHQSAAQWDRADRDISYLYTGSRARLILDRNDFWEGLDSLSLAFLETSLAHELSKARWRRKVTAICLLSAIANIILLALLFSPLIRSR